jgi:tetratricopeptide (TPR) repeat protein
MKVEPLGSPGGFLGKRDPRAPAPAPPEQVGAADVDDSRVHVVDLGLSPEESARLGAGVYQIRVLLPLASAPDGVKQLSSNIVRVTVAPAAPAPEQEKQRLEKTARYYREAGKWQDAHRVALELVQRQDADSTAFILLGDALNGLRRDDEALAAYRQALAALPKDTKRSPDYLFARMEQVQQRLDASGKK